MAPSSPTHALTRLAATVARATPFRRTTGHRWRFWQNALQPEAEQFSAEKDHRYNDPSLSPFAFLQEVYRDSSVPMDLRMLAAERAGPYDPHPAFKVREQYPGEHRIVIKIEGLGIEALEQIEREPEVKLKVH
jgi:hypothetical protein